MKNITFFIFLLSTFLSVGQSVYFHDFGTTTITSHPYTVAPGTFSSGLTNSQWSNSSGGWTSFAGSSGQAISLSNSSGTPTITLSFSITAGCLLNIDSYSFWRQRSTSGAQNWSLSINGTNVGSGTVPTTGANTGTQTVTGMTNLTGNVTIVMSLTGASGTGTFRLDDFNLVGNVTCGSTPEFQLQSSSLSNINCGTSYNFGSNGVGNSETVSYTILNSGVSDLTISGFNFSNSNFSLTSGPSTPLTIAAGASQLINVTYNPTASGTHSGTLTIQNNDTDEGNCQINLSGIGIDDCEELFFSEYVEGTSNNKYLEIYNPTTSSINLSNYEIRLHVGGGATSSTSLTGTLASGGRFVLKNASATVWSGTANMSGGAANYNGDDALELFNLTGNYTCDIIGRIGEDPGSAWTSGSYSTQDKTLIRNTTVSKGVFNNPTSGFPTLATEWQVNAVDYVSDLSIHSTSCVTLTLTPSNLTGAPYSISCTLTDQGSIDYSFTSSFSIGNQLTVQLSDATGDFTAPVNLTTVTTTASSGTINFEVPEGMSSGTGYRIRIISSLPSLISNDNGTDISITNLDGSCFGPADICAKITQFQIDPENGNNGTYNNTGEFIQICNVCNTDLDISCAIICLTDNNSGVRRGECVRIPDNTILGPGECYLIGGNGTFTSGTPDWSGISLDLNWHTCGCVTDTEGLPDGYVGVLSDGGEDITLFDETGTLLDAVTFASTAGANYSQTVNVPASSSCSAVGVTIPPSSAHTNTGSTPVASINDSGRLLDCLTNTWLFANHNSTDVYQNLNPLSVFDCVLTTPLSVELTHFIAMSEEQGNSINWETATEKNNDYFILERSEDGYSFREIATIDGAGESTSVISYNYFDHTQQSFYYRLVQVDINGARTFYGPVYAYQETEDLLIAPNPNSGIFSILVPEKLLNQSFSIVDISGTVILNGELTDQVVGINLGNAGKGIYFLQTELLIIKIILY